MKVASFNANGIRARLFIILDWLGKESPDVLCLQETKVQDAEFPVRRFEEGGYCCAFRGEKGYNGVAILSRSPLKDVSFGFADGDMQEESRLIDLFKSTTEGKLPFANRIRGKHERAVR